jgi:carboxylesterase
LAAAFQLPGTRPVGCLLIHGFTATADEVRPLGEALSAAGFPVVGAQLAGHGTSVSDLVRQRWQDWAASVREAIAALDAERVVVVGMSLGGLLALHLAGNAPASRPISGLVCCGTPLKLHDRRITALRRLFRVPGIRRLGLTIPKRGRDISDPVLRAQSRSYPKIPLAAVVEVLRLQEVVTPLLAQITVPTLILHARHDHTAPVANAGWLAAALTAAGDVQTEILERSWHVITEDVERDHVARTVIAFCERVAGASRR